MAVEVLGKILSIMYQVFPLYLKGCVWSADL